jgi:hypothetical protein
MCETINFSTTVINKITISIYIVGFVSMSILKISHFYNFYYHTIKIINHQRYELTCMKQLIFLLINKNKH